MRDLLKNVGSPKSFWKHIKSFSRKQSNETSIDSDTRYNHFEHLFRCDDELDLNDDDIQVTDDADYDEIDKAIFDGEIMNSIKHLRAGKAPGADEIPPSFYIQTAELLLPILNRLTTVLHD
ncbi:hypothetical protein ACF0H5_024275 [Mactra antiquata]